MMCLRRALQTTDGTYASVPGKARIEVVADRPPYPWHWRYYNLTTHEIVEVPSFMSLKALLRNDGFYPGRAIWEGR